MKEDNAFLLPLVVNKVSHPSEMDLQGNKGWVSSSAQPIHRFLMRFRI